MPEYDLLILGGQVHDPQAGVSGQRDIAVELDRVVAVEKDLRGATARQTVHAEDLVVVPGIIDPHVHLCHWIGGAQGHYLAVQAGTVTAVDFSGPFSELMDTAREAGRGLNLLGMHYVKPGDTVPDNDPSSDELRGLFNSTLEGGALGVKIMGGHYPLTPAATRRVIETAAELDAYCAFHAGTTEAGSDLRGFLEAVELAGELPLHIAHVNSYCRGRVLSPMEEARVALEALQEHPNIVSESYLSPFNGTSARCKNGKPESLVTQTCLLTWGYEPTERGLKQAILDGYAHINVRVGESTELQTGDRGVEAWEQADTDITVSFPVNDPALNAVIATATHRVDDAIRFTVNALCTDGGGIPRNTLVTQGVRLVQYGALSWDEFVLKTSIAPAQLYGLQDKGSLAPGADADITIIDPATATAHTSVALGQIILRNHQVVGSGATFYTTERGEALLLDSGFPFRVLPTE